VVLATARAFALESARIRATSVALVQGRITLKLNHAISDNAISVWERAAKVLGAGERATIMPDVGKFGMAGEIFHVRHFAVPICRATLPDAQSIVQGAQPYKGKMQG
jgi:hypothetical protein